MNPFWCTPRSSVQEKEKSALNLIQSVCCCCFHLANQFGVYGKQTSALFVAVSAGVRFTDNVLYDGPRAGVNINDGFGGGTSAQGQHRFSTGSAQGRHRASTHALHALPSVSHVCPLAKHTGRFIHHNLLVVAQGTFSRAT